MLHLNHYGVNLGEEAMRGKHGFTVEEPVNKNAKYYAKVVGWREHMDKKLVVPVTNEDGLAYLTLKFQVAVWWPDVMSNSGRPNRTNNPKYPIAETYSLSECVDGVPILAAATEDDGPPYRVFLTGEDLVSDVVSAGWVGAGHITYCPEFQVVRKTDTVNPTPQPINGPLRDDAETLIAIGQRWRLL